jgi:hypothetical protein
LKLKLTTQLLVDSSLHPTGKYLGTTVKEDES